MQDLTVTLVQCELAWEAPEDNRRQIENLVADAAGGSDLVVLPEMFTTGFSMNAVKNAEPPGGATAQWLGTLAARYDCAFTGSIAVTTDRGVVNRMLFVTPEDCHHYDKRHLFRMAGEDKRYAAGNERVIVPWRGWRVMLQICYDLRFPVFTRNLGDYDLMLFVANWPQTRRLHWRQLLIARAIENLSCVVGVNRVGKDAKGLEYSGDSLAIAADGQLLQDMQDDKGAASVLLKGAELVSYRERFPFHLDADHFRLE